MPQVVLDDLSASVRLRACDCQLRRQFHWLDGQSPPEPVCALPFPGACAGGPPLPIYYDLDNRRWTLLLMICEWLWVTTTDAVAMLAEVVPVKGW